MGYVAGKSVKEILEASYVPVPRDDSYKSLCLRIFKTPTLQLSTVYGFEQFMIQYGCIY